MDLGRPGAVRPRFSRLGLVDGGTARIDEIADVGNTDELDLRLVCGGRVIIVAILIEEPRVCTVSADIILKCIGAGLLLVHVDAALQRRGHAAGKSRTARKLNQVCKFAAVDLHIKAAAVAADCGCSRCDATVENAAVDMQGHLAGEALRRRGKRGGENALSERAAVDLRRNVAIVRAAVPERDPLDERAARHR